MTALTQDQAEQIVQVLEQLEKPILDREVMLALASQGELVLDGALTARPVSDTSTSYPEAAYGHMGSNQLGLGYQAAQVCMRTPTYGRLLLSSSLHPGDRVSMAQTAALVHAAVARIGMRPLRRTDLLTQRLEAQVKLRQEQEARFEESQQAVQRVLDQIAEADRQLQAHPAQLAQLEAEYLAAGRKARPFSRLGKLHTQQQVKVGAHTSAWVAGQEQGCLLKFTDHSVFAGRSLSVSKSVAIQLALPFARKVQT
ncbi:MAG: hypothetical protein EHM70_10340 [Chloroflexota bacterium]|nr:MAG: hypothetical protein EHM70_10340 [Chloroflexota bacterium]